MASNRWKSYLQSEIARRFYVLLGGTFFAQVIGYALAPILTRLYTPEEMGELNLFLRITGFLSAAATLRYELSLPLPKQDQHAFLIYRHSFRLAAYLCGAFLLIALPLRWVAPEHSLSIGMITVILIATIFLVAINLGTNWSIRTSDFKRVTRQKLLNSIVTNGLKWALAFSHWGGWALILATVAGYVLSSLEFLVGYTRLKAKYTKEHSRAKTFALMKEHRDFPTMNLPIVMMDNVRDLILGVVIFGFYSAAIFGSYSHTLAMLSLPIMLVSGSLSQVLFHQLAERRNERKAMYGLVLKTIAALVALSVIPFGVLRLYGQEIFVWVFGGDWLDVGRYAEMMTFWLMLNFIFSPLAVVPIVLKKQKFAFVFSTVSALLQLMPFVWCYAHHQSASFDFEWALRTSSNILAGWFILLLFIYLRWVRLSDNELNHAVESNT